MPFTVLSDNVDHTINYLHTQRVAGPYLIHVSRPLAEDLFETTMGNELPTAIISFLYRGHRIIIDDLDNPPH